MPEPHPEQPGGFFTGPPTAPAPPPAPPPLVAIGYEPPAPTGGYLPHGAAPAPAYPGAAPSVSAAPAYPGAGGMPAYPGQAGPGQPARPVPAPPRETWRAPRRVETVPGTPFGVVHLGVPPVTSGPAVAALVTGIASILVALVVACFGVTGADAGWGGWAAGAFALLAGLLGIAGVVLGEVGRRQTQRPARPPGIRFTGRGLAVSGTICAAVGLGLTVVAFAAAVLLQAA